MIENTLEALNNLHHRALGLSDKETILQMPRNMFVRTMYHAIDLINSYDIVQKGIIERKEQNHTEWRQISPAGIYECIKCGQNVMTNDIEAYKFCHGCGRIVKT